MINDNNKFIVITIFINKSANSIICFNTTVTTQVIFIPTYISFIVIIINSTSVDIDINLRVLTIHIHINI
ncbi:MULTISPECIES: hypothetical protein [Terrisporobacter]|uniref:hypothetical protein n=1 Tax=Terrisporobacter TaxID=1505652 RepID=UPI0038CD39E0